MDLIDFDDTMISKCRGAMNNSRRVGCLVPATKVEAELASTVSLCTNVSDRHRRQTLPSQLCATAQISVTSESFRRSMPAEPPWVLIEPA